MKKRLISLLLAVLMVCSLTLSAEAALSPTLSGNVECQSYHVGLFQYDRFASPVWSYLHPCAAGMERVEYVPHADGVTLVAEQYTMSGELVGQKTIPIELPMFGGCFAGTDANYVVFGQAQSTKTGDDSEEVIRVVRYTKDWQRKGSVSICGSNTTVPFDAGSLRMTEDAGFLYVHTCHEMYQTSDGYNHQANLTFCVRKNDMTVTDIRSSVMNADYGYVSHSFNQFLALDGDRLITLDHGDAGRTRSGYLYRHKAINRSGKFLPSFYGDGSSLRGEGVNFLPFNENGYNETGANFGGLAVTGSHYLVVGSSVDQSAENADLDFGQRNVFVASVPKDNFTADAVQIRWLTDYTDGETRVFTPQLVKVSEDRCLLLWCAGEEMFYVFLKADGTPAGQVYTSDATLSDCVPVVMDGKIWWYVTEHWRYPEHFYFAIFNDNEYDNDGAVPTFYCIDPANPGTVQSFRAQGGEPEPLSGWQQVNGRWYYYENNTAATGWKKVDNVWYFFTDDGVMQTGWQKIGGSWYWFRPGGAMVTGWQKIGGVWYYFASGGQMQTGWREIKGTWYYLKPSGAMAAKEWCGGWWLNADGSWTYPYKGSWHQNAKGWWFGDESGWYACNTKVKINDVVYAFDAAGYMK